MRIFLAGTASRKWVLYENISGGRQRQESDPFWTAHKRERERERDGNAAGVAEDENISRRRSSVEGGQDRLYDGSYKQFHPYILESFYYADADTERLIPYMGDFLLDSGAFTFMQNSKTHVDWNEYIERYAAFIKRNKVEKYFELDIDSVVGYEKVLEYRNRLETLVGWRCIPVWHTSRGKEEFIRHCEEFPYVALGGIVGAGKGTKEYQRYHKAFPWFIKTAHEHGAKIHGLGYTSLEGLTKYHFDSVDSTAWTTGNRYGYAYRFNGKSMDKIDVPEGKQIKNAKALALNNFNEWVKFQRYAETHL